jgi:hypothetical protein
MVQSIGWAHRWFMRRVHFFTGSCALCGSLLVVEWSEVPAEVTCPQCRELLSQRPTERRPVVLAPIPASRPGQDEQT